MAQPYELLTVEARQSERATRARKREAWPQNTELQRLLARAAAFNEQLFQGLEDLVVETPAATLVEETERWRIGVRMAVKRSREQALQLELGVRGGEEAVETVMEPKDVVEGMTEEEAKRWRAYLKPKAGGGKVRGGKAKPAATATSGGGASGGGASGSGAQNWGGWAPPPMQQYPQQFLPQFPQQFPQYNQQAGGYPMQMQWGGEAWAGGAAGGLAGGASYNAGQGNTQQAGGRGGMSKADKVARFPCDNCGQSGHWSYDINCPNYEVYLEKQRVKAETLRASRAAGSGTVALRNNTTGNLNKITKEKDYAYGIQKGIVNVIFLIGKCT
jgi:hypothetical protein